MLPNLLRKVFAAFTRNPLRRPCRAVPRFRPALELLERRLMPYVTVNYSYNNENLVVDASSSSATSMTVS